MAKEGTTRAAAYQKRLREKAKAADRVFLRLDLLKSLHKRMGAALAAEDYGRAKALHLALEEILAELEPPDHE